MLPEQRRCAVIDSRREFFAATLKTLADCSSNTTQRAKYSLTTTEQET